ncbi:FliC/FljB family flagellin [Cobetia sp. 14N.309.X.WAT.E.A4]|uniref:FliC/FljB family flagellin n=1 Tax=Cobetia sp. 14N.309.X.WAT.E.A4 TaxID=2998323 RepID=UPI0025AECE29|nr:FliC/FljB family flagellin [Cobetia sp. 14N.309.X.WAT.E.A4]MDN2655998.1 FliC/FljB family flagellin [Cobetia sp. 14N.309.X.WAT.E.A4]
MASVINTNTLSMVTQQNLNQSQNALNTSMERLSSGMRINSAKDDAAGQAIANRMDSQITGLSQAQRNANDGISVAQTAEGALNQVNDNVQRIRELTVQAQNGTNSSEDLQSIQDEINQRTTEIDRISRETDFNGVKVLSEDQSISIQVGANDGETINIDLNKIDSSSLGLDTLDVTSLPKAASFGNGFDDGNNTIVTDDPTVTITDDGGTELDGASVFKDSDNNYYIKTADGEYYEAAATNSDSAGGTNYDTVTLEASSTAMTNDDISKNGLSPLSDIDDALNDINSQRSALGALQNRFDSTITNLSTIETNLASAQSRIQDADYAEEVSSMTTAQILQQAGTSMLTQANQVPQNVLSLLG